MAAREQFEDASAPGADADEGTLNREAAGLDSDGFRERRLWTMTTRYLRRSIARRRRTRLGRIWRAVLEALYDAWIPPAETFCQHGYAEDWCEEIGCGGGR